MVNLKHLSARAIPVQAFPGVFAVFDHSLPVFVGQSGTNCQLAAMEYMRADRELPSFTHVAFERIDDKTERLAAVARLKQEANLV